MDLQDDKAFFLLYIPRATWQGNFELDGEKRKRLGEIIKNLRAKKYAWSLDVELHRNVQEFCVRYPQYVT
jgi:hypothetical protein